MARVGGLLAALRKAGADAFVDTVAATALDLSLPLVTADRRLARSGIGRIFLVADFV